MSDALRKYVDLEKVMLQLESIDERAADAIRDVMDDVWYALSADERSQLDSRNPSGPFRILEAVRLPVTPAIVCKPVVAGFKLYDEARNRDWRGAA